MMILQAASMKWAETEAVKAGTTYAVLMEKAGIAAAREICAAKPALRKEEPVLILCGKGNNGGDGLVVARELAKQGRRVQVVYLLGSNLSPLAAENRSLLAGLPVREAAAEEFDEFEREALCQSAGIIVDACFGTGFAGELRGQPALWMAAANRSRAFRAALDLPSGMDCGNGFCSADTFRANLTITFAAAKPAHFLKRSAPFCGEVRAADIGIGAEILAAAPGAISLLDRELAARCIPPRTEDSNKGSYGRMLAVGGCAKMTGAILMASMAAMRCGVGRVTAAIPEKAVTLFGSRLPEAVYLPLPLAEDGAFPAGAADALLEEAAASRSVLLGCGMSVSDGTMAVTRELLRSGAPLVLDADGLNCLAREPGMLDAARGPVILTPHMAEFSRLCGKSVTEIKADRFSAAAEYAQAHGAVLVLKDSNTVVAAPDGRLWMNKNGNSGMAKAGSGDVLAGMTASLLAQCGDPVQAALAAVYLHAAAGDAAAAALTPYCMTATDIIAHLPDAFRAAAGSPVIS